ncbi:MAG: metallophosphoesterase family protein [Lachnospiraceae bacterium]|nr:metallophosphoesterase family protein [Lachnospiraceae bacterium]
MHRIAVISDTHGMLREEVIQQARTCEAVLHAGDIGGRDVINKLREAVPVYAIKGNIDKEGIQDIPEELYFTLYGFNFYMVHNRKHIKTDINAADIIIYGHSHIYKEEHAGNVLYLNPGSCGPGRFRLAITMAVITLDEERHIFSVEKINCIKAGAKETGQKDMYSLVKNVIKDMDAGKNISVIATKNGAQEELVEKICRIYSTHPGINTDGILNRLDIWNL